MKDKKLKLIRAILATATVLTFGYGNHHINQAFDKKAPIEIELRANAERRKSELENLLKEPSIVSFNAVQAYQNGQRQLVRRDPGMKQKLEEEYLGVKTYILELEKEPALKRYISEVSPKARRGFYSSLIAGLGLAALMSSWIFPGMAKAYQIKIK